MGWVVVLDYCGDRGEGGVGDLGQYKRGFGDFDMPVLIPMECGQSKYVSSNFLDSINLKDFL